MIIAMFAVGLLVFLAVVAASARQRNRLDEAFRRVADAHDGTHYAGGLFGRPSIKFTHRGVRVLLDTFSTGGKHRTYYTQLHVDWLGPKLRLEVFPERFLGQVSKFFGSQDIEIGSAHFDPRYIIRGNDVSAVRQILSPRVQTKIEQLRALLHNDDIYVGTRTGRLLIKKRQLIRDVGTLRQFISLGLELHEALMLTDTEGIEFVERPGNVAVQDGADDPICQVCGERIDDDVVECRSCRTPHHGECWKYFGACSTYGCGQKKHRRVSGN